MGSLRYPCAALVAGVMLLAGPARAHEFVCKKRVNGQSLITITDYPATVTWDLKISNSHPIDASTAIDVQDALLEGLGFTFNPDAPLTVAVGASVSWQYQHVIADKAACDALAAADGLADENIDNVFKVKWDVGERQCSVRVVCGEMQEPPPPSEQVTRTMGFFKTHLVPLQACLDQGAVDLGPGFDSIDSLEEALGVLWGNPQRMGDGTVRNELEKARFLLARQTLVAQCNVRLFDADPSLVLAAQAALGGNDCADLKALAKAVDGFNNSGTGQEFPNGVTKGPSTPRDAKQLAEDPSIQTGGSCSND